VTRLDAGQETTQISGKNLGLLRLAQCLRCFWLLLRLRFRPPFQIFPGIFSTIDSYVKHVVHDHFDRHGGPPAWLSPLGDIAGYIEPPHWSRFKMIDQKTGIVLTGAPDGVLRRPDGSIVIVDYKTAKFSATQDELYPMYETQLNCYALIAERCGMGKVTALALVYLEPMTEPPRGYTKVCRPGGFDLGFKAHVLDVPLLPEIVPPLLRRVRELAERTDPPAVQPGCRNCAGVERMVMLRAHGHQAVRL
jgi:hypothetical protein